MRRSENLEARINRLQSDRLVLLTKGGELNSGEKAWIAHIEKQLEECGISFKDEAASKAA